MQGKWTSHEYLRIWRTASTVNSGILVVRYKYLQDEKQIFRDFDGVEGTREMAGFQNRKESLSIKGREIHFFKYRMQGRK